jgi:hypothetical protein
VGQRLGVESHGKGSSGKLLAWAKNCDTTKSHNCVRNEGGPTPDNGLGLASGGEGAVKRCTRQDISHQTTRITTIIIM